MQLLQPVLDDGLGRAGDLAPDPLPVRAEPEADHAPSPSLAVPVPAEITAGGNVFEEDPVLAPAASWAHGFMIPKWGPIFGANLWGHLAAACSLRSLLTFYGKEKVY
jgi:hypothetical protein